VQLWSRLASIQNAFKNRHTALVDTWIQDGDLVVPQGLRPVPNDLNRCEWWAATRIAPFENTPEGFNFYMVSIPRVPKSEAPEGGPRLFINVLAPEKVSDIMVDAGEHPGIDQNPGPINSVLNGPRMPTEGRSRTGPQEGQGILRRCRRVSRHPAAGVIPPDLHHSSPRNGPSNPAADSDVPQPKESDP
jgi:hypothetical protein